MANKTESRFESRRRARRRALQALYQWHLTGMAVGEIITQFREEQDFSNVDKELFGTLVRKVSKNQAAIDEKIAPFLDRPINQLDVIEHVILSIGAYELLNSIEVPHQVIIDEAINLAKMFGQLSVLSRVTSASMTWMSTCGGSTSSSEIISFTRSM